ncbi:hypothetical protein CSUI_011034, partial [Cystoisospora suis]
RCRQEGAGHQEAREKGPESVTSALFSAASGPSSRSTSTGEGGEENITSLRTKTDKIRALLVSAVWATGESYVDCRSAGALRTQSQPASH